jgi:hypothetical protein
MKKEKIDDYQIMDFYCILAEVTNRLDTITKAATAYGPEDPTSWAAILESEAKETVKMLECLQADIEKDTTVLERIADENRKREEKKIEELKAV